MNELTSEQLGKIHQQKRTVLYLYTPFCGTCQLASKMLSVIETIMPSISILMKNLNYIPEYAKEWGIESVPCLLIFENGKIIKKIYAFHSVDYLYQLLKKYVPS